MAQTSLLAKIAADAAARKASQNTQNVTDTSFSHLADISDRQSIIDALKAEVAAETPEYRAAMLARSNGK